VYQTFTVTAHGKDGRARGVGGDVFKAELRPERKGLETVANPAVAADVFDCHDGTYVFTHNSFALATALATAGQT
jgi:hypothetical protein